MASREVTYVRWKKSVLKKLRELRSLYGVDACVIINSEFEPEPVVLPSKNAAQLMMMSFKLMLDQAEQMKNTSNLESLEKKMIAQADEKIDKQCMDGEIDLDDLSLQDSEDLQRLVDRDRKYIDERIQALELQEARETME